MKKKILFVAIALLTGAMLNAQQPSFEKSDKAINLGVGIGNTLYTGIGYRTVVPPISISYEQGIIDGIMDKASVGVGGYLGYSSSKWDYDYVDWGYRYSNFILGVRGAFHYPFVDKLDTYAGVMLGYDIVTAHEYGNYYGPSGAYTTAGSGVAYSAFAGARYYFTDNFAAMAELGYGIAILNFGMALKF